MKKYKISLLLLTILIVFAACGQETAENESSDSTQPESSSSSQVIIPQQPSESETDPGWAVTEDDTLPPREGMVRSPLTNEWVDSDVAATRPIAVIIPNEASAIPQYNLSEASILYEANVEGRMSRLMGIFEDWKGLDKIGNIRSLRNYYAYWAFEWDAFLVHLGGPFFIDDLMAEPDTQHLDGLVNPDAGAFFRSTDRSAPHNAYAAGSDLENMIRQKGYPLTYRGLNETNHFQFATKASPNTLSQYNSEAESAIYIDMSGCYPLTRCYFEYNEEDGLYYRSQHLSGSVDGPHIDGKTGKQLTFKNILVQYVKYDDLGNGYLSLECHDDTMDGWFFTCGKGIHVTWKKSTNYGATKFYDDYGNEIVLNTGKTMICVVEEGDNFSFR